MKRNERIIKSKGNDKFAYRYFSDDIDRPYMISFPYVGGNSSGFRCVAKATEGKVNIIGIDPPGHGVVSGRLYEDIEDIIELYYQDIIKQSFHDFYIFGHSLGGLIGYMLAVKLEQNKIFPKAVIISATTPPNKIKSEVGNIEKYETDEYIREELLNLGGKYSNLSKSHSLLLYAYIRIIKSDYRLIKSYIDTKSSKLTAPGYILYSEKDDIAESKWMHEWRKYFVSCKLFEVGGKHDYILENAKEVGQYIEYALEDVDNMRKTTDENAKSR